MKFEIGKVYSGTFCGNYFAFEVLDKPYDYSMQVDITYSGNEDVHKEGPRYIYTSSTFIKNGEWKEVATDYTGAKIDLLLDLKQTEWLREEVGEG